MKTMFKISAVIGLAGLGCLVVGAPPDAPLADRAAIWEAADYTLEFDSIFARGCMGSDGGLHGCMCPMLAASEFTGGFTLTPQVHSPTGHRAYDVTVDNWLATFGDELIEISGQGYYDTWTDLDFNRLQCMTLTLDIYDEEVSFFSGVVPALPFSGEFPNEIHLGLESDTECFGYMIVLDAERQLIALAEPSPESGPYEDVNDSPDRRR